MLQRVKYEIFCECGGLMVCMKEIKSSSENGPPTEYVHQCIDCVDEQILYTRYPQTLDEEVTS